MSIRFKSCEVNVTLHCNLRCAYCDHSSPTVKPFFLKPDQLAADLEKLRKFVTFDQFKLIGGEPLLHPEIVTLARIIKESGISQKVTFVTNGVLLHRAPEELWKYINRLWISIYPGIHTAFDMNEIISKTKGQGIQLSVMNQSYFRITTLNKPLEDQEWINTIYSSCATRWIEKCTTLKDGYFYICPPAALLAEKLKDKDKSALERANGFRIDGSEGSVKDFKEYLNRKAPLPACAWCLGTIGKAVPHRQLNREELETSESCQDNPQWLVDVKRFPLMTGSSGKQIIQAAKLYIENNLKPKIRSLREFF